MASGSVDRWIEYWSEVNPDGVAVKFDDRVITWRELNEEVEEWAAALAGHGLARGDRVGCMMGNRPEFYALFFAVARAGLVFVPVNLQLTPAEIKYLVQDAEASLLVHDRVASEAVHELAGVVRLLDVDLPRGDASCDAAGRGSDGLGRPRPELDDLVAILYTSGTTGRPKGAMFTHSNLQFTAAAVTRGFGHRADDVHLVNVPLYFTGGLLSVSLPIFLSGGTVVLSSFESPVQTMRLFVEHQITFYQSVPAILNLLVKDPEFSPEKLASLRLVGMGSAPAPIALLDAYIQHGIEVVQGYAWTEGGGVSTLLLPQHAKTRVGSSGQQTMFTQVKVVRPDGSTADPGESGEVLQRGPTVTAGYWRNTEATADLEAGDGWIRTGDIGVIDSDGFLTIIGRLKDVIITGGINVYPAEVESVLAAHPDIREVAVVGLPHETYGETVTAVVVPVEGRTLTLEGIRDFCSSELAPFKLPLLLKTVAAFPRTGSGKVRKQDLRSQLL